jgi:hypothetical protein
MEINDILTSKLEKAIELFEGFNAEKLEEHNNAAKQVIAATKNLSNQISNIKIPEELRIQHAHEHRHINAGTRFVLIILLTVIITASSLCWYFYNACSEVRMFKDNYETYNKNLEWNKAFYNYMLLKNPQEVKRFAGNHLKK